MANITWFKEISKKDIPLVGGKGTSLGEMFNAGIPVPPGFAVTAEAYKHFLESTGISNEIYDLLKDLNVEDNETLQSASKKIQEIILKSEMPRGIAMDIKESYDNLNVDEAVFRTAGKQALDIIKAGRELPFVAVRSSATAEDLPTASFAGQQATFLNIRGGNKLVEAVQKCWASLFTARAIYYRVKNDFPHEKVFIAVVVQKMVKSEKSGVIFSVNPMTNNENEIVIEAGWGLGETVVSGSINPDQYIVDKNNSALKSKKINDQDWMYTLDPRLGHTVKKNVSQEKVSAQILNDSEIRKLAELSIKIEHHYGSAQDIEYAIEGSGIYIVQSRPVTTLKKPFETKEEVEKEEIEKEEAILEKEKEAYELEQAPIETVTAIKVIMDLPDFAEKAAQTGADGIGLLRCEFMILKHKEHPYHMITTGKREELVQDLTRDITKIALAFKGKPVWYRTLDAPTDEFRNLEGGEEEPEEDNPMMGWRSIRRSLDQTELLLAEFEAIKRVHDSGLTNVGVMLPLVTHVEQISKAKEYLKQVGLEPMENIEFGVMIETPASVQIIEEICEEGVDFISFGTNDLTQFTLACDRNSAKVQKWYNEKHPAVLRQINHVVQVCKKHNVETSICGQAGSDPEMAEFLVKIGIDSISANPDAVKKIRHTVAKAEKKLLLNVARKNVKESPII